MISTGKIESALIGYDDTRCFNSRSNNQNGSAHNKRAKRKTSKKRRRFLNKDMKNYS